MRALEVLRRSNEAVAARVAADVAEALADESPEALVAAARRAAAALGEEGRRVLARSHGPAPACSAGCSFCCHVHVDATMPELLSIAEHLERTWSRAEKDALVERLARQVERVGHLSDAARWEAKVPCALLGADGCCWVYEVRPLRCRAFHSCSVAACREAFEADSAVVPPPSPALERAHDAVEAGFDRALVEAGLGAEAQRLEVGLLRVLAGSSRG